MCTITQNTSWKDTSVEPKFLCALMLMYCTQQASSYGSSMDLNHCFAEEIIFKCSHGQSSWREQGTQYYLHLPIKSIFVSWVNNLCYSPSWKTRQGRHSSTCRACMGKQHPTERNLVYQTSNHQNLRAGRWGKKGKKPQNPECLIFLSKFLLFISRRCFKLENSTYIICSDSQCLFVCSAGLTTESR